MRPRVPFPFAGAYPKTRRRDKAQKSYLSSHASYTAQGKGGAQKKTTVVFLSLLFCVCPPFPSSPHPHEPPRTLVPIVHLHLPDFHWLVRRFRATRPRIFHSSASISPALPHCSLHATPVKKSDEKEVFFAQEKGREDSLFSAS